MRRPSGAAIRSCRPRIPREFWMPVWAGAPAGAVYAQQACSGLACVVITTGMPLSTASSLSPPRRRAACGTRPVFEPGPPESRRGIVDAGAELADLPAGEQGQSAAVAIPTCCASRSTKNRCRQRASSRIETAPMISQAGSAGAFYSN